MVRLISQIIGYFFLLLGVIGIIFPFLPIGLVCTVIGLMILIPTSPRLVRFIKNWRRKSYRVEKVFHGMTRRAPMPYRRVLRQTEITPPY